jgi:GDP-D-mannose dehydratase
VSSEEFIRPSEVDHLLGESTLAEQTLGWEPKVSFNELVTMMVGQRPRRPRLTQAGNVAYNYIGR